MEANSAPGEDRPDRRPDDVRLADYTISELRNAAVTAVLLALVLALVVYMVRHVFVALVVGAVVGAYTLPLRGWIEARGGPRALAAILTITLVTVPVIAILAYGWSEVSDAAAYLEANSRRIATDLNAALHRLPYTEGIAVEDDLSKFVETVAERGRQIVTDLRDALDVIILSVAVFLFTVFYVLTEHQEMTAYVRAHIPRRYEGLAGELAGNVKGVIYGALYATFLTQLLKGLVVLGLNLLFGVPLPIVLALLAFLIGFFPVVGSWVVYVPIAIYLAVFQQDTLGMVTVLLVGFLGNTMLISMYLRPKIAAHKSRVLDFYWMFIALVTGVYTFGLVGIIVGPVLVGVLKAVLDTVTGRVARRVIRGDSADAARA